MKLWWGKVCVCVGGGGGQVSSVHNIGGKNNCYLV